MSGSNKQSRCAFSVIELLVCIGVVGILVGLLMSAVQWARNSAERAACLNNMKQIGLGLHNYHDQHANFPATNSVDAPGNQDPYRYVTWRVLALPQVEQDSLWAISVQACQQDARSWRNPPHIGNDKVIKVYVCPADARMLRPHALVSNWDEYNGRLLAYSSYLGVRGAARSPGVLGNYPPARFADITDGTANTLLCGERPPPDTFESGAWYVKFSSIDEALAVGSLLAPGEPCVGPFTFGAGRTNNRCDQFHFWSLHTSGANFCFADGSARFIPYSADPIMPALATRAGGEVVELP